MSDLCFHISHSFKFVSTCHVESKWQVLAFSLSSYLSLHFHCLNMFSAEFCFSIVFSSSLMLSFHHYAPNPPHLCWFLEHFYFGNQLGCRHYIIANSQLTLPKLQIQSKRLVMMSASLCTQTGLCCLTSHILNIRVCFFIDFWYTSLTSVQHNLECGLAIVTENFSQLNLDYTTSLFKFETRSDTTSHTIPDIVYLSCTLN